MLGYTPLPPESPGNQTVLLPPQVAQVPWPPWVIGPNPDRLPCSRIVCHTQARHQRCQAPSAAAEGSLTSRGLGPDPSRQAVPAFSVYPDDQIVTAHCARPAPSLVSGYSPLPPTCPGNQVVLPSPQVAQLPWPLWVVGPDPDLLPCSRLTAHCPRPALPLVLGYTPLPPEGPGNQTALLPPQVAQVPWPLWVTGSDPDQVPSSRLACHAQARHQLCQAVPTRPPVPLRVGGGPGLDGLLEGLVQQLMPMITELIQKAIAEALGQGLGASAGTQHASPDVPRVEPRAKRHKGGGREPKRKSPDMSEDPTRGAASAGVDAGVNRRVVLGKGTGGQLTPPVTAQAAAAEEVWHTVSRKREDQEPFELRSQDWDVPIVPHDAIGRKLDELPDNKPLEAVVLAVKSDLDTVRTILRGTAKPRRIMCVELKKEGKERIPGKVGNQLRFRQADITTHYSQGASAPKYAGTKASAVAIAPTKTTTVYIRIPAAYCSADRWKEIRSSPAKAVAAWAAEQRVILADSWGWVEESPPKQLFGKARLAEKEMSSLLCVSGRGGIFVDCIRDAIPAQVQWLARTENEPAAAYLERGLRMSAQLGLASQGGRIGARSHRDPSAAIPRIWVFPHVPLDWGPPEVTKVLAQAFDPVTLIHHRRTGRDQLYRFRGTHKFGDRDILPLQVQLTEAGETSEITLWATVAPVKAPSNKQTWLRERAVPLIEPKPQVLKPAQVKVPQASSDEADSTPAQPCE